MRFYLRGNETKEGYLWLLLILELLSSSTACGHNSWGWRWHLRLIGFRQWDICPSLIQGKPSRFTIRSSIYSFLYSYPVSIRDCFRGMRAIVRGFLARKPQIIRLVFRSQFTFRTQEPFSSSVSYSSTRWLSDPVFLIWSSYQQFWDQGGVSS